MESSILTATKKTLGLAKEYTIFDEDVITHINAAFSILNQLGVGPLDGFMIEDDGAEWEELDLPLNQLMLVKTYIYLKVSMLFDPPQTSFLIEAKTKQIEEYEWRLNVFREVALDPTDPMTEIPEVEIDF
jgi:hypothetical protein